MERIKSFVTTSLMGGFLVVLPVVLCDVVIRWLFLFITQNIKPVTRIIIVASNLNEYAADLIAIAAILVLCFFLGILVRTRLGTYIYGVIEEYLLTKIPGYRLIKETTSQIIGKERTMFSSVALVNVFGNDTLVTAFVTDEHPDGSFTVFVPTGPNPTSGFIYHMGAEHVHKVDYPMEDAMRSVISCGAGSGKLLRLYR
jgi:uncharacterized membrane protein